MTDFVQYLMDPWNKIIVLEVQSTYPNKDNCHRVKITRSKPLDRREFYLDYVPKAQLEFIMELRKFNITSDQQTAIAPFLKNALDEAYQDGVSNEYLSNIDKP